jgi:hypothetical protein
MCGTITLGWAWDTDGAAMSFGRTTLPERCRDTLSANETLILNAILAAERWSVENSDRIELGEAGSVRLSRFKAD